MNGLTRRELLRSIGMAAAVLPVSVFVPARVRTLAMAQVTERLHALTEAEVETLRAIVDRIMPSDENGPGALEARAERYIDRALAGALKEFRPLYTSGLAALDASAQSLRGTPFARLSPSDRDAVLTAMQTDPFFNLVRAHTIQGVFSDPFYGGNANFIGWDLIGYPGVRTGVSADYQKMGAKPGPNHRSAYDFGMFSQGEL
jgi:gluconate 2-dehydrogenase gamma chain